ncbi:hypothetical protein AKJ51_05015 [candidate division MSBL1 archaeon SCGC-AAA382A20]|uniref:Uncharacterized protein n=1 Tax=candidate division MSBL1 archaeon SCGC-AAA382A20 TaxID=1698280 RepID=A0A133VGC7_9EURY|nr:hypothetical protein AKJ51_05015 [candidate division MSBL1 archaeon SCGC-AAA382A20]
MNRSKGYEVMFSLVKVNELKRRGGGLRTVLGFGIGGKDRRKNRPVRVLVLPFSIHVFTSKQNKNFQSRLYTEK